MKLGMDILCASQVATSISGLSMDHEASSSSSTSTIHLGGCGSSGRAIDRHNPIIRDATRLGKVLLTTTTPVPPCSSYDDQPPININIPKPHRHHHKNPQKNNSSKENTPNNRQSKKIISNDDEKREITRSDHRINSIIRKSSWSCTKPSGDFVSPPGSSRYLLSSTHHHHKSLSSDFDPLEPYSKVSQAAANSINKDEPISSSSSSSSKPTEISSSSSPPDQVIVLSVSLHCRGCERKMKKHLSKMEGVTHYDIDFKAKKLTVVGDVTPLAVLASVSKVKNAQLLTLPLASSVCTNISEIQKERGIVL